MPLRLLADMNISPQTVQSLRAAGWDIIRVSDRLAPNAPDTQVLVFARDQGRVIVTLDLDFSTLLALGGHSQPSSITFRLDAPAPDAITTRLPEIVRNHEAALLEGCAITVSERLVRVRPLPIG